MKHFPPVPRAGGNRLQPRRRAWFYALFVVLAVTGAVWLLDHFTRDALAAPGLIAPWSMKLHGGAAMLALVGFGLMWDTHVRRGWMTKRSRWSGVAMGISMLVLSLTGFGLYYFDGETLRQATEWLHWIVGVLVVAVLVWHLTSGRRSRRAREALIASAPASYQAEQQRQAAPQAQIDAAHESRTV